MDYKIRMEFDLLALTQDEVIELKEGLKSLIQTNQTNSITYRLRDSLEKMLDLLEE